MLRMIAEVFFDRTSQKGKIMKKSKHILALLLAALLLTAAACNSRQGDTGLVKQTGEPTSAEPATDAPTTMPALTRAPTPEPTQEPTPETTDELEKGMPSREWLIDDAWEIAKRIGDIHGIELKKELVEVRNTSSCSVSFYSERRDDGSGCGIYLSYDRNAEGEFCVSLSQSTNHYPEEPGWYNETHDFKRWREEFNNREIVVTVDDLVNAGCTETEGEEYMEAVGRCYAKKLALLFSENAPEGFPARCQDARLVKCSYDAASGEHSVLLAVVPDDICVFNAYYDDFCRFYDGLDDPELWGWLDYAGTVKLELVNGSWVGRACLDMGG